MVENIEGVAYLRKYEQTFQCELSFNLHVKTKEFEINEEINALRKASDTISSLLTHIRNKVNKIIQDQCKEPSKTTQISIIFKHTKKNKKVNGEKVLNDLCNGKPSVGRYTFTIFNKKFTVTINAPLVKHVQLPEVLYANFNVQPIKFKSIFTNTQLTAYNWYKSLNKSEWKLVGRKLSYNINENDLGHYLKLEIIPKNEFCEGPKSVTVSQNQVELVADIPFCPFENRHKYTEKPLHNHNFRIVSYNILSNRYSETNEQFPYCSPKALAIDYRKQLILKELLGYNADIICLQEIDAKQYSTYFKEQFQNNGFGSIYNKKGFIINEGLACVFNKSKFQLVSNHQIVLSTEIQKNKLFSNLWEVVKKNEDVKRLFLKQLTSLQINTLKPKSPKSNTQLVVGNTHLFYHPEATHIRLIQIYMVTTVLNKIKKSLAKNNCNISVILCGDFNSGPDSPIVKFMLEGSIQPTHEECLKISENGKAVLYHEMCFESACGMPKYTNYTNEFKDCLDYIFTEKNKFQVLQSVPLPSEEELSVYEGLPNEVYPSDHLALVADIKLLQA